LAWRFLIAVPALIGVMWLIVTFTPVLGWWIAPLSRPWDDAPGDMLIVLGSEVHADGMVGYRSYLRALHAARVYRTRGFHDIVATGGNGIAQGIRTYLIGSGVPAEHVLTEDKALSTRENALFTARMISSWPGRKVLLTSDIHTYRAWRTFRKAGLDVRTSPAPDAGKRFNTRLDRWNLFLELCVETTKIGWYRLRGSI
jgi:uncharacterized SAM-binding protein YcdF (DUF218 family)